MYVNGENCITTARTRWNTYSQRHGQVAYARLLDSIGKKSLDRPSLAAGLTGRISFLCIVIYCGAALTRDEGFRAIPEYMESTLRGSMGDVKCVLVPNREQNDKAALFGNVLREQVSNIHGPVWGFRSG